MEGHARGQIPPAASDHEAITNKNIDKNLFLENLYFFYCRINLTHLCVQCAGEIYFRLKHLGKLCCRKEQKQLDILTQKGNKHKSFFLHCMCVNSWTAYPSRSLICAVPSVGLTSPVSILKVVVFPAPFSPNRPKHCKQTLIA